jgi:2-polyprenyl-3-methyl-5-hydroxy-6-metoxy-1,4-benzoquinol methylase
MSFFSPNQKTELTLDDVQRLTRYKLDTPRADAIQEIADFLKLSPTEVEHNFTIGELARVDWQKQNPQTKEQVEAYYRETQGYIYDLMAAFLELRDNNLQIINNLIRLLRDSQAKTVLDFGVGAAWYPIILKRLGANVTGTDLAGQTFTFAQWRTQARGLDIPFKVADDWASLGVYDFIYAFSVMEHAYDPVGLMRQLKNSLAPNGVIYLQNDFYASEPMHLQKNLVYKDTFAEELKALGYQVLHNFDCNLMVMTHAPTKLATT